MIGKSSLQIAIEYMEKGIKELDDEIYGEYGYMNQNPPDFGPDYVQAETMRSTYQAILDMLKKEP